MDSLANAQFEEVTTLPHWPRKSDWPDLYFAGTKPRTLLGPIPEAEAAALAKRRAEAKAAQALAGEEGGGGVQMLRLVGGTSECITNSPLFITNTVAVFATNTGWTVQLDVQGTNGPVDIFTTTNLVGNGITNSQWVWLERGSPKSVVGK